MLDREQPSPLEQSRFLWLTRSVWSVFFFAAAWILALQWGDFQIVPLVLAMRVDDSHEHTCLGHALHLARGLREGLDFRRDDTARACLLTTTGRLRVELAAAARDPLWFSRLHRENAIQTALTALHAFQLD